MKEMKTGVYLNGEESNTFKFYTNLSTAKKLEFVNSVVSIVVDGDNYNSIIRDLIFDYFIINIMTDVDTSELEGSFSFLNDVEEFLESTTIVEVVKANVDTGLMQELNNAIDLNIQYKTGIHYNPLNDALTNLVNTLEKKVDSLDVEDAMEMVNKFNGMTDDFTTENVVKAYLQSDVHKKNLEEIEESK